MFFLAEGDIAAIIAAIGADRIMDRLISGMTSGFEAMARERVYHISRRGFAEGRNLVEWMPVSLPEQGVVVKLVSYCPDNPLLNGRPTIDALIAEADPQSGAFRTLAEGRLLTAMRTGAASAVATALMAPADSTTLGLIGCGAQAVTQAHALSRILPLRRVLAFDRDAQVLASLPARLGFLGLSVQTATPEAIVQLADVICTATSNEVGAPPVVSAGPIRANAHINAIGSDFPGKIELSAEVVRSAFVAADLIEQAAVEGECQHFTSQELSQGRVVALADIVTGGAAHPDLRSRLTVFDSTGIAMEDAIALQIFREYAEALGRGREIGSAASRGDDPHDPYAFLIPADAECA